MSKLIWLSVAAAVFSAPASKMEEPVKSTEIAPARDGDIAIRQELCAAREAGTVAAYDLFIARHPDHPLIKTALEERRALLQRPGQ